MNKVIITADDAGHSDSIDNALIDLSRRKILTRICAFSNGLNDISWLSDMSENFNISLGLHLTLSYNKPLLSLPKSSKLIDSNGFFIKPKLPENGESGALKSSIEEYLHYLDASASYEEIKSEFVAQYNHFVALVGKDPDFITLHHDIDVVQKVNSVLLELWPKLMGRFELLKNGNLVGYHYNFIDGSCSYDESKAMTEKLLSDAQNNSEQHGGKRVEVVFHPAMTTRDMRNFTAYTIGRTLEYRALTSSEIMAKFNAANRIEDYYQFC